MKTPTKKSIAKWWKSIDRTTKILFASVGGAVVVIAGVGVYILARPLPIEPNAPIADEPAVTKFRHPLSGVEIEAPLVPPPRVFGVMIENSADAWPLAGLEEASLVIEAPVEGNIPRFIVFFSELDRTEKIGPVRSARPYYIDWNDELDAIYAHVGGSPEALDLIRNYGTLDLNEFYQGEYYYRWGRRFAPHNAYTTMDDLRASVDELSPGEPEYASWKFVDAPEQAAGTKSLTVDWTNGTTYDVDWKFDAATRMYMRDQGGTNAFTESGVPVAANNVVVMEANVAVVDAVGRRHIDTIGSGKAYIAQNGEVTIGTWKKEERTDRLRFYDATGAEVNMIAGKTWIEVLPSLSQVQINDAGAGDEVIEPVE